MSDFLDALRAGLDAFDLKGRRVLAAVSGGADSVALLCGLAELCAELSLELGAAHLDHRLRGEESAADAVWVGELCDRFKIPCVIESRDVRSLHAETKQTLEESARQARYDFLKRTAIAQGSTAIALGHTADDQAETVLHHILRGTGLAGLRGIPREREISAGLRLIRPLLNIRRSEIEGWLAERGQDYRTDASNIDPTFTRNRLRHQLLPLLEKDFNPQVIPALLRLREQAAEMEDVLDQFAEEELRQAVIERSPHRCRLRCESLAARPPAFRRVCFTLLWREQNWPRGRMTFAHWNRLADLVAQNRGALSLPGGLTARRRKDGLTVEWQAE